MRTPHPPRLNQPDLFSPPPDRPPWAALPPEARAKAVALLAELLRATHDRQTVAGPEVGHE